MIEESIYTYLVSNLSSSYKIYWGKIDRDNADPRNGDVVINFFKSPSRSAIMSPSYLDLFQISIRCNYVDSASTVANEIINLFHLFSGHMGDYQAWVTSIDNLGTIYEEEDIVHIPLQMGVKYSLL